MVWLLDPSGRHSKSVARLRRTSTQSLAAISALDRPGQPGELASIFVQLAAEDASFTTGNIYGAGGGKGQQ
jgi:hypothetical protein